VTKRIAVWATSLSLMAVAPASAQITGPAFPTDGPPVPAGSSQITIKQPKPKKKKKKGTRNRHARAVLRAVPSPW
jgi:hypothetical protein